MSERLLGTQSASRSLESLLEGLSVLPSLVCPSRLQLASPLFEWLLVSQSAWQWLLGRLDPEASLPLSGRLAWPLTAL